MSWIGAALPQFDEMDRILQSKPKFPSLQLIPCRWGNDPAHDHITLRWQFTRGPPSLYLGIDTFIGCRPSILFRVSNDSPYRGERRPAVRWLPVSVSAFQCCHSLLSLIRGRVGGLPSEQYQLVRVVEYARTSAALNLRFNVGVAHARFNP